MADYSQGTKVTYRHEWTIPMHHPWGVPIAEFHKALRAANHAYERMFPNKNESYWSDDYLRVSHNDDEIVIYFETDFPPHPDLLGDMTLSYQSKETAEWHLELERAVTRRKSE